METNDQILRKYFEQQKVEISDDGFSERVSKALPPAPARSFSYLKWALTLLATAAICVFFIKFGPELASNNLASLLSGYEAINKVSLLMGTYFQGLWSIVSEVAHISLLNIAIATTVFYFLVYKEISYRMKYQE